MGSGPEMIAEIKRLRSSITNKDNHIFSLEHEAEAKDARISALQAALGEAGEALEPFMKIPPLTIGESFRKAKAVREKIMGVMQPSENAETKGSDASRLPNDQSDEGEGR